MTIEKRKKDPNDDEKVKFCFRGYYRLEIDGLARL